MGRFSGLAGIKTNAGGLYFLEGDYLVELSEVKFQVNRKKQEQFIVAGKVLESTNPARAPGCKPSQVITIMEEYLETCWGNVKQFAGAVMGLSDPDAYVAEANPGESPEEAAKRFWDESIEYMISEEQPLRGTKIRLNVTKIKKKDTSKGEFFSKHVWGPVIE